MSYKNKAIIFLTSVSIAFGQEVNLSPLEWGEGEIEKYLKMDTRAFPDNPIAIGKKGAVTTTFHSSIKSWFRSIKSRWVFCRCGNDCCFNSDNT